MSDLSARLAGLSAERRRLLERLLQEQQTPRAVPPAPPPPLPETRSHPTQDHVLSFYDAVNQQLDAAGYGSFARFLNYGYVSDGGGDRSVVQLPAYALNKPSVQLVLELIGDCPLERRAVLDVGCGRGGLVDTVATYFTPRRVVGLDLTARAVAFASTASRQPSVRFLNGDAQHLPFADASFDVVTNLESSHTYPDVTAFYRDVFRVLERGGWFLYSDALPTSDIDWRLDYLRELGFTLALDRDITRNVLLSCDLHAAVRTGAFHGGEDETLDNFLGAPGSNVYEELRERACVYRIFHLRKGRR